MDAREDSAIPQGMASGRLEGISFPDLLWGLGLRARTGVLHVKRDEVHRRLFLQDGQVIFAASSDPDDRLGELLLREGLITLDALAYGVARLDTGKRLGRVLVEAGYLSPDNLVRGVLAQIRRILFGLFGWRSGTYWFQEGPLPTKEVITLGMKTGEILLEGIRRIGSFTRIRSRVGPPRTYYRLTAGWHEALTGLTLNDSEDMLLASLEHGGATVDRLCRELFLSNFEIYQSLWAMKVLGVIEERETPYQAILQADYEGVLDRQGVAPVLVRLCRAQETGVLYLVDGSRERTIHIKEGRCVFATSNDLEDGLLSHLLRRGVISLRDREETAKRLLSNKRVGTILRELGVIEEDDLAVLVREQLSEVIFGLFTWTRGSYTFVAGELPTIEEITLESSLEALVANGLRRVSSWRRVSEGCGGLQARVKLLPDYLEILDRMNVSSEEWEVVSAVKEPLTVAEVCRESRLDDYVVCQTIWALNVLEALEVQPVESPAAEPQAPVATPMALADEAEAGVVTATSASAAGESEADPAFEAPTAPADEAEAGAVTATSASVAGESEAGPAFEAPMAPADEAEAGAASDTHMAPADEAPAGDLEPPLETRQATPPDPSAVDPAPPTAGGDEADSKREDDIEVPPLDSPGDVTTYIPKEEIEAALTPPQKDDPTGFELLEASGALAAAKTSAEAPRGGDLPDGDTARREAELPDWEPPADLDDLIARFNACQRLVYRTIRAEVGAGAVNFIRACTSRLDSRQDPFSGADLGPDGAWDAEALKRSVVERRLRDPSPEYERLIELEIDMLRGHIGDARAQALREKVYEVGSSPVAYSESPVSD